MNWQILGAGAIGSLFASHLAQQNQRITLLTKMQQLGQSLALTKQDGTTYTYSLNAFTQVQDDTQVLLVCLKAFQVLPAITALTDSLPRTTSLVLMHNGMGTLEPLTKLLPEQTIFSATTTHGALLTAPFSVTHTGAGSTIIGGNEKDKALGQAITAQLNDALPNASWSDDITHKLWLKLAINCAINPLTAIHQVKNGALLQPQFKPVLAQICQEFCQVATRQGLTFSAEELLQQVRQVAHATGNNYSSMNRDIHHGRRSENDAILGYLLQCAAQHQLHLPLCQQLYQQVQQLSYSPNASG
ncbi:2-dehydropantoate 2-reductase [Motilimonas cestriensis]|uniref:2-dehydropantoate 2-reductase n=1 Tax=Motilimonas cestriensis TaxID=2742685 RepID=A0ABS8WCN1_9GAMM|nr:2-dehydropantoate 2-reductase [Motilimonas cestriensis]MCE2595887.1 2-dehydropantoate 2-reductase [Motilimonas cestriensis]